MLEDFICVIESLFLSKTIPLGLSPILAPDDNSQFRVQFESGIFRRFDAGKVEEPPLSLFDGERTGQSCRCEPLRFVAISHAMNRHDDLGNSWVTLDLFAKL